MWAQYLMGGRGLARIFCAALIILGFGACSTHVGARDTSELTRRAVIFVPGFKGSALADAGTGDLVWVTPWEALFGDANLALDDFGVPLHGSKTGDLVPSGVLGGLSAVFGLYHYDIYEGWLEALAKAQREENADQEPKLKVIAAPYDWRKDLRETAIELAKLVRSLRAQGVEEISIVAHSMGGLPTAYFLRYGAGKPGEEPEWSGAREISKVVFAYTPFGGTLAIMRDFRLGVTTGRNDSLLDQVALSSFPSSYELLPAEEQGLIIDANGAPLRFPMLDDRTWRQFRLGLLNRISNPAAEDRLLSHVANAKQFWSDLHAGRKSADPGAGVSASADSTVTSPVAPEASETNTSAKSGRCKVLYFVTDDHATLSRGILSDGELWFGIPQRDELEPLRSKIVGPGDGLIPRDSLEPPQAFREALDIEQRSSSARHDLILNDPDARSEIIKFVLGE